LRFKDVEVAAPVVVWLLQHGWEVYQEVVLRCGRRADIVAVKDGALWIVVVKTTLNLEIMGQAAEWEGRCHRISFAVPVRSGRSLYAMRRGPLTNRARNVVRAVHEVYGVGCMMVRMGGAFMDPAERVHVEFGPVENESPRMAHDVEGTLCEERRKSVKANSLETYWTPLKRTCERLRRYVLEHPGCSISQAVACIETHYSSKTSAMSNLLRRASAGLVPGVRVVESRRGKRTLYFLQPHPGPVDEE